MTRSELHNSIIDGSMAIENVPTKKLRGLVADFDMGYQPDFEAWCRIWLELDTRDYKRKQTQDDVNKYFDGLKKKTKKIDKDFFERK